jgi:Domain of unknown function (DUF4190)
MSYPPGPPAPEQPGYGPEPPGTPPGYAPILPTNNKATAALITGITTLVLSWCCGLGVLGIVAVVLGIRGRAEVRASQGTQTGDGLALAGIITGAIAIVIGLAVIALIVVVVATGSAAFTGTSYDA